MAAEEEWYFEEEGCLQFSGRPTSVTFSPTSNCFICTLNDGTVEVVDARSSLRLKRTEPALTGLFKLKHVFFMQLDYATSSVCNSRPLDRNHLPLIIIRYRHGSLNLQMVSALSF